MRILTRYILKEIFSHALLGGALFTFILFMRDLGRILALVVHNSSSLVSVAKIFLFTLPNTFTVTIPMAVLVGILLGLSRLAADSEITAMRAAGIGVWSFVGVVAIVSIMGWGIGLANSLYFAPRASRTTVRLEAELLNAQASYEVQRGVFYEDFKNYVLYVQDVRPASGAANWREIFLADLTDPEAPKITTGASATVVNGADQTAIMRMRNGTEHQTVANQPDQYNVSTFSQTDLPLTLSTQEDTRPGRNESPILAMSNQDLLARSRMPGGQWYLIELYKRFAYPAACLVLMLV